MVLEELRTNATGARDGIPKLWVSLHVDDANYTFRGRIATRPRNMSRTIQKGSHANELESSIGAGMPGSDWD